MGTRSGVASFREVSNLRIAHMLLSTPTISQHLHEDRNCSGFLKIHIDFSVRRAIIGICRKQGGCVNAKTATVPSDL